MTDQIEQRLKEIDVACAKAGSESDLGEFSRKATLILDNDVPALCKALRRADVKFAEIESLEINGVSNIAKWARDDILTILSGSDATEKWLNTHPDPRLRALDGEEGQ